MKGRLAIGCLWFGTTAGSAFGVPPTIQILWDESPPPVEDVDYVIDDITNPDFPDLELVTGSQTWRVWSTDPDNPNGIGDIGVIKSPQPDNFGVKIEGDGGNPGARNVKGIILDPTDASKFSSLTGSISAKLIGDLSLQQAGGGTGGHADFSIPLGATGNITVPRIPAGSTLSIGTGASGTIAVDLVEGTLSVDEVSGSLTVLDKIDGGLLDVETVAAGGTVTIAEMVGMFPLDFSTVAGTVIFQTGIKAGQFVSILGRMTATALVDLNGADVA